MQSKNTYAVIGHPIGHTLSPFIHARLFSLSGREVQYDKLDIAPDQLAQQMNTTLGSMRGFNVTIPHKKAIIPYLDELDAVAKKYGAVNCVEIGEKKIGHNTDVYGFTQALESRGIAIAGKVLVCGSGGVAGPICVECVSRGCDLYVAAIDDGIEAIKRQVPLTQIAYDEIQGGFDLVVQATPVGMYPNINASVLKKEQLADCGTLFDVIYNPQKTLLMQYAEECRMTVLGGMSMLVWQAVKAHEYWYGATFDPADIEQLIADASAEVQTFGEHNS